MTLQTLDRVNGDPAGVDVPEISAVAAGLRAAARTPDTDVRPADAGREPAAAAPAPGASDLKVPEGTRRRWRKHRQHQPAPARQDHRRGGTAKAVFTTTGLVLALALMVAAAGYLTFPHTAPFSRLHANAIDTLAPAAALGAIISAVAAWNAARRLLQGRRSADVLTVLAAAVATIVSATGMWAFFTTYVPTIPVLVRIPIFAFLELATVAEALRARDNSRRAAERAARGDAEAPGMDVDALAMWVLTSISAFLASLASTTVAEAIFRLAPPLVAAWLWERALVSERQRIRPAQGGKTTWRISPQRILARIGVIDPAGKTIGEAAAQRRTTELALAAEKVSALDAAGTGPSDRRRVRADHQLRKALRLAVDQTDLATNPARQQALVDQILILRAPHDLVTLDADSPWAQLAGRRQQPPVPPVVPPVPPVTPHQDGRVLATLADSLALALRQGDGGQVHELLARRDDYAGLVHWLGRNGKAKRLMAAASLYAAPGAAASPAKGAAWIAGIVPGEAGRVDKAEIRRLRELLEPTWTARNYTGPAAAGGGKDETQE